MHYSLLRLVLLYALLLFLVIPSSAQKVKEVSGEYTYWLPRHVSRAEGEQIALERAMIEAVGKEFGTLVNQQTQLNLSSSKDGDNTDFYSIASTILKGEWVETIGQPVFDISLDNNKDIVISCTVKGHAREIKQTVADLDVRLLCNGTTNAHEASTFIHNDLCYLSFVSPIDGYIAVYLEDDAGYIFRMLPFAGEKSKSRKVEGNKRYMFFTRNDGVEEQYRLQTSKATERNNVNVIFSPNEFIKPIDSEGKYETDLTVTKAEDFRRWLTKSRALDPDMQVVIRPITIVAKQD